MKTLRAYAISFSILALGALVASAVHAAPDAKGGAPYEVYVGADGKKHRCYGEVQRGDPDAPGECAPLPGGAQGKALSAGSASAPKGKKAYEVYVGADGKKHRCYGEVQRGDPDAPGECAPAVR